MDRNITTFSLEIPTDMKDDITKAVKNMHYHNMSELVRTGIRKVLDEVKKQVVEQTGNTQK